MSKEIPINCRICKYCIEDYDTGELICNFDEENPNLLSLGECHEFKLGEIRLGEFLEEEVKKIKALEEKVKDLEGKKGWAMLVEEVELTKRVIALESDNKLIWGNMNDLEKKLEDKQ